MMAHDNDWGHMSSALRKPYSRHAVCCSALLGACVALAAVTASAQGVSGAPAPAQKLSVVAVTVEGNTLLPQGVLDGITAGLPGADRSMADLTKAATRIQDAYRSAGYGGVVAFVPEQDVSAGQVVIRVVEGKLAAVRIKGNQHFSAANVRAGLPGLREGTTPLVRMIDRDIQLSNENPAKQVRVTLAAGSKPGEIDADVDVIDRAPIQLLAGFNNTGNDATGKTRLSLGVQNSNVMGLDHVATLQVQTSPGHTGQVRVFSAGYRVPFYARAASVDAFYAYSSVANGVTATPAGPLTFVGQGTVIGLRGNLNLERIGEYDHRATAGLDWRNYKNDCAVGSFGSAGCGSAGVSVIVLPVSLGYTGQKQGAAWSWGVSGTLVANVGGSAATTFDAARPGARKNYTVARFSAFGEMPVAGGFALSGRLDSQYSTDALVPGEKFGLGGASSARGYLDRELAGDYGLIARLELLGPNLGTDSARARPQAFMDHGRVANHNGMPCRGTTEASCTLRGVGAGVRLNFGKNVSAALDVARALNNGVTTVSGDVRAHLSITVAY